MIEDGKPIFLQIAEMIEDTIVDGSLPEGAQAPSTNEIAAFSKINPATAAKGVNMLVEKGILNKRRGIGMFVAPGAQQQLLHEHRDAFAQRYVDPLLIEASKLGLTPQDLATLITTRPAQALPAPATSAHPQTAEKNPS